MYIGIDVGGTSIKLASFKTLYLPKAVKVIELKTQNNYENDFDNLAKAISELAKSKVSGIGVGIAAVLDKDKTQILKANNIKSWEKQTLKKDLENLFKCKIVLEKIIVPVHMCDRQNLQQQCIVLHQIRKRGIGIDHHLIGQP